MTKDEIAQAMQDTAGQSWGDEAHFQRFAALLLAAEREACAELAFEMLVQCEGTDFDVPDAIRARGNT